MTCINKVRPERFMTDELNGLTVPTEVEGRLIPICYLRSREGNPASIQLLERQKFEGCQLICKPFADKQISEFEDCCSSQSLWDWYCCNMSVDPADLFTRLAAAIKRSVDFTPGDEHGPEICSLWCMLTYFAPRFETVPYIHLYGTKSSGKSTLLNIFLNLVFRPFDAANITPAAMFRCLHQFGGTILLDEAETFGKQNDAGRLLNVGYKRGARVRRAGNLEGMEVFGPKALASTEPFNETLASRCIRFTMTPSQNNLLPMDRDEASQLRDDLHILALDFGFEVLDTDCDDQVLTGLKNRQKDLWYPLLVIAQWLEKHGVGGIVRRMQQAATSDCYACVESGLQPEDESLLLALYQLVRAARRVRPIDVLDEAKRRHADLFRNQVWLPQTVARRLSQLGVPDTHKSNGDRVYRVTEDHLSELMARHGMPVATPLDDRLATNGQIDPDDDDAESMAA